MIVRRGQREEKGGKWCVMIVLLNWQCVSHFNKRDETVFCGIDDELALDATCDVLVDTQGLCNRFCVAGCGVLETHCDRDSV